MAFHTDTQRRPDARPRRSNWEFRVVFAATFLIMLVPTLFSRLSLSHWGENEAAGVRKSIFHEARARTDQIVPFMFMG